MPKSIPLTQGKFAIVDDADFEYLNRWGWFAFRAGKTWYAIRNLPDRQQLRMHAVLLPPKSGCYPDHKDRNGLNNQRSNLRLATKSQNAANCGMHIDNKSGYKCVCWHKRAKKWIVTIRESGKQLYLGLFHSKLVAARVYDEAAVRVYGEYAATNKILMSERQSATAELVAV